MLAISRRAAHTSHHHSAGSAAHHAYPSSSSTTTTTTASRAATVTSSHQLSFLHHFPQNLRPTAILDFLDPHRRHLARFDAALPALHHAAVTLARPPLDHLRAVLPAPLQSLVPTFAPSSSSSSSLLHALLPESLLDRLVAVGVGPESSLAVLVTALALLVSLLFLLRRVLMASSSWRSYLGGGRYSPFSASAPRGPPPQVTESDYHYIGPDDIVDPPAASRGGNHAHPASPLDDASQPDVLILRHRGYTYPMHFPAYCIGEGILRVGELRRYAADKTGTADPQRIKLLYKGRTLKDDAVAAREEGLKQNSELTCIISESAGYHGSSDESESASDSDFFRPNSGPRMERAYSAAGGAGTGGHGMAAPRVDVDGTVLHDDPPKSRRKKHGSRHGRDSGRDKDDSRLHTPSHTKTSSTSRPTTPSTASAPASHPPPSTATSTSTPPSAAAAAASKVPLDELGTIAHEFRTKWVPLCDAFLAKPPPDEKSRLQEYNKLSESILAQIIFKLDGVSTDGDPEARARRKAVIQETQAVLNKLDAVGKPGGRSPTK